MANSAVLTTAAPAKVLGTGPIYRIRCQFDTGASDLTVITPGGTINNLTGRAITTGRATDRFWVVGIDGVDATAYNMTIKSGANTITIAELAAYQGWGAPVDKNVWLYCGTSAGEALVLNSSAAAPSNLIVSVVLASRLGDA